LFTKINKNRARAQWVCPGVGIGLKFNLNSLAKVFNNCTHIKEILGLEIQYTLGIRRRLINALAQFNLKPTHKTAGSKIEKRLPIYFK
jgi:hypothetical protein